MTTKTVILNVGGTKYEVSRSLLSNHPNTMLARSISEEWQHDPDAEIFIELDGERFKYCLDYLRHGRVILPTTVPKAAVMMDLEYIGVENVENSVIETHEVKNLEALLKIDRNLGYMKKSLDAMSILMKMPIKPGICEKRSTRKHSSYELDDLFCGKWRFWCLYFHRIQVFCSFRLFMLSYTMSFQMSFPVSCVMCHVLLLFIATVVTIAN